MTSQPISADEHPLKTSTINKHVRPKVEHKKEGRIKR